MDNSGISLAVIDYGMGNLRSVVKAWEHVGARVNLVQSPDQIGDAGALVFPGQGGIVDCMRLLKETGLDRTVAEWIAADRPYFGICLGMQALFEHSEEGDTAGLGIFKGKVERFRLDPEYKIPHMGWNSIDFVADDSGVMENGLNREGDQFYFVHSYHVVPDEPDLVWCETEYGGRFVSGITRGNCYATQFHPEKSQAKGLQIYRNFLEWIPQNT